MTIKKNGVRLDVRTRDNRTYYFLPSDVWQCTTCGAEIHIGYNHRKKPIGCYDKGYSELVEGAKKVYLIS
jgi:hypothetical protein